MSKIAKSIAVLGVVAGLGVAALPLSSYAAESAPVTISAIVDSSIAVTAGKDTVDLGTIAAGTGIATQTVSVTVSGSVSKYNLGIVDKDADASLKWTGLADGQETAGDGTEEAIPATADLATATKGWAFRKGESGAWTAVPASGATAAPIVPGGNLTTAGVTTDITFGVKADGTLKNGIYQDQVIFTATSAE